MVEEAQAAPEGMAAARWGHRSPLAVGAAATVKAGGKSGVKKSGKGGKTAVGEKGGKKGDGKKGGKGKGKGKGKKGGKAVKGHGYIDPWDRRQMGIKASPTSSSTAYSVMPIDLF